MEKELSVIDGILANLAGIQSFYEFEYTHLSTFLQMLNHFQSESLTTKELSKANEVFKNKSGAEISEFKVKLQGVEKKIRQIKNEISSRTESRKKLIDLFNALKSVDFCDTSSSSAHLVQPDNSDQVADGGISLPIMEIREDLNDDGEVIGSEVKPYQSHENQLKKLLESKVDFKTGNSAYEKDGSNQTKEEEHKIEEIVDEDGVVVKSSFRFLGKKDGKPKKPENTVSEKETKGELESNTKNLETDVTSSNSKLTENHQRNYRPFMIREEIDEDGNIINSSMSQIPEIEDKNSDEIKRTESNEEVNEDQLAELFEDMGLEVPREKKEEKIEEKIEELNEETSNEAADINNNVEENHADTGIPSIPQELAIQPNELYTLEMIADQLNQTECEDENDVVEDGKDFVNDDNVEDFEWPKINDVEDDDEVDMDSEEIQKRTLSNMFGSRGQNLFTQKLMDLRRTQSGNNSSNIETNSETVNQVTSFSNVVKPKKSTKKSVKFNSEIDVKNVPDIWDDIRKSNADNELLDKEKKNVSLFKRSVSEKAELVENEHIAKENTRVIEKKSKENIPVISDIVERPIVETTLKTNKSNGIFKMFDSTSVRKQVDHQMPDVIEKQNLTKLAGKKSPSRFKLARVAEMGKKYQRTHVPVEGRKSLSDATKESLTHDGKHKDSEKLRDEDKDNAIRTPNAVLKKNLNSLTVQENKSSGSVQIQVPKDTNPLLANPSLDDEDYEVVRNEATETLFDDDDDMIEEEFVASDRTIAEKYIAETAKQDAVLDLGESDKESTFFPEYKNKEKNMNGGNTGQKVVESTLDYKSLSEDLDTMAKAYVLGLYDDDLETQGQVIEELKDFERHNEIVEQRSESKLHGRVQEINNNVEGYNEKLKGIAENDDTMVVNDIVENDMKEVLETNAIPDDDLDIELNDETMATQVALDYTKMRASMIHKYKGGFKETDKEKEFVRPEGSERVSRFKAARLGI